MWESYLWHVFNIIFEIIYEFYIASRSTHLPQWKVPVARLVISGTYSRTPGEPAVYSKLLIFNTRQWVISIDKQHNAFCWKWKFADVKSGFGGAKVACWLPTFAGSNPAEAVGFLKGDKKSSARLPSEARGLPRVVDARGAWRPE